MTCSNSATIDGPAPLGGPRDVAYARRMTDALEDSALMLRYRDGDAAAFEVLYLRTRIRCTATSSGWQQTRTRPRTSSRKRGARSSRPVPAIDRQRSSRPTCFASRTMFLLTTCGARNGTPVIRMRSRAGGGALGSAGSADGKIAGEAAAGYRVARFAGEQRDAFLLHEEGGLSIDDIALVTGVHRETAKSRLRYANSKLRASLRDPASGDL